MASGDLLPKSQRTTLNGVTPVTVLSAPAAGKTRTALVLRFTNLDTAVVDPILSKNISATVTEVERRVGIAVLGVWKDAIDRDHVMILQDNNESLEMKLAGAIATVNPVCIVEFIERDN